MSSVAKSAAGSTPAFDPARALAQLDAAAAEKKLSPEAVRSIRTWLTEARYAEYAPEVARQIAAGLWKELDDAFWTVIPFGTGGRRGKMYPVGSNAINDRTIGESAQGVADYVRSQFPGDKNLACAIAYDTRHQSRHFAELCSEIMIAAGFKVWFLDGFRSTPELSFTVRYKHCTCGIMVTASHNPPSDNAVKVYWSTGGQVLPPHDAGIIERVMHTGEIRRQPFAEGLASGRIEYCQVEVDAAFIKAVHTQALPGPRDLKIIYSPLHGVGASAVLPALAADGFTDVELFGPQATPDGDFPNVPNHVANPEIPAVFDSIIVRAKEVRADVILASDPDCDRLGVAAPKTPDPTGPWETFTGNQIGVLLTDYLLDARRRAGTLSPQHYLVKTLVTTEMIRRQAEYYGVRMLGNLQVGFKYIGQTMDEAGPKLFVFGCEESHGYLVGDHVRDKDAAVAAMLMAELAATAKARGQTLHQRLEALYWQFGYHLERQVSIALPGSEGMKQTQALMARFRNDPPRELGGLKVLKARDYLSLTSRVPGAAAAPFDGPKGDMVILDLQEDNYIAVRPSGTEPKVKFYLFGYCPAEQIAILEDTKREVADRMAKVQADLAALARQI
jgi:phosphoglucomutase/phosphomannomutase